MPDITMCAGGSCSLKDNCYRYKAFPNPHRQSYFMQPPAIKDVSRVTVEHTCDYHTPMFGETKKRFKQEVKNV